MGKKEVKVEAETEVEDYSDCFRVSGFQGFRVSGFQSFRVSEFQSFRVSEFGAGYWVLGAWYTDY